MALSRTIRKIQLIPLAKNKFLLNCVVLAASFWSSLAPCHSAMVARSRHEKLRRLLVQFGNLFVANGMISLFLLIGCSGMEQAERAKVRKSNCVEEPIFRRQGDYFYEAKEIVHVPRSLYPWETESRLPRITKEFFRCKGSTLNPPVIDVHDPNRIEPLTDCGGYTSHGLPIIHGKEGVYPILIELLNYVQKKTKKRVVITCGHRCPLHNRYADPSEANQTSKHQIGAEVDFYVQGMEERPQEVVGVLMQYFQERGPLPKEKEGIAFKKLSSSNSGADSWMNREVLIQLYPKGEGRDGDNRHPHPYICIQARFDAKQKEPIVYSWSRAHQGYPRF